MTLITSLINKAAISISIFRKSFINNLLIKFSNLAVLYKINALIIFPKPLFHISKRLLIFSFLIY